MADRCRCGAAVVRVWTRYGLRVFGGDAIGLQPHECPPVQSGRWVMCLCDVWIDEDEYGKRWNLSDGKPHACRMEVQRQRVVPQRRPDLIRPEPEPRERTVRGGAPVKGLLRD